MEGQYIINSKNAYINKLLSHKKINEAGRILKTKTYEPLFSPQEIHPESSPSISNDINLPLDEIANDLKILDDHISIAAFDMRNYIQTTVERLNYSKKLLVEEIQRKQDAEILCKKYDSFLQVLDLSQKDFTGNFHAEDNIFSAEILGHSNVNYEIVSIEGNGYEGNKYVLTSDNKPLQTFMDTSNRKFINDRSLTTSYEYSRITINDSEKRYCEDANKDTIEAKCVVTIRAEKEINCLKLLSENKQLKLGEVLISDDGLRFTEVLKESIDINNINAKIEMNNYIPKSGLICFPSTRFVRISLESCGYTGDKLGFEAIGVEDEFDDKLRNTTIELKQLEQGHLFKFRLKNNTSKNSINKNNICITNLETDKEMLIDIQYSEKTNMLFVKLNDEFEHNQMYLLNIQNIKDKSDKKTNDNFKVYFTMKDDNIIFFEPKYFVETKQTMSLDLNELTLDSSYLTSDYIYVLNIKNELVDVNFKIDNIINKLVFYPKKAYEFNSEYRLFINNGAKTTDGRSIGNTYCMKFKTQESTIEHKSDMYFAPTNSTIYKDIDYDIDIKKSECYIIDNNNNLINAEINNSERKVTEIQINTKNFKKDRNYYCIFNSNSITNSNIKIEKQIMFKIFTENTDKLYLDEELFIPIDTCFNIKLDYDIEKSYAGLDYIYVLDKNYNKLKRCHIDYDFKEKNILIKPPKELYSNFSDYYIVISKDTLTTNLKPIGKTIIKHFKTISKNYSIKNKKTFLNSHEDILINFDEKNINYKAYVIDKNNFRLDFVLENNNNLIKIKCPTNGFTKGQELRLIIETEDNKIFVYILNIEPSDKDINKLNNKYYIPLNYDFTIKINGIIDKESIDKNVYILNQYNEKILIRCSIINNNLIIGSDNFNYEANSKYKIVLDKNLIVNGSTLNKYITCDFTTVSNNIKYLDDLTISSDEKIKILYDNPINKTSSSKVEIINSEYEKINCAFEIQGNDIIVTPTIYDNRDRYTLYISSFIDSNGFIIENKSLKYTIK